MNFNGKRVALIGPAEHTAETYQKDNETKHKSGH